MKQHSLPWFILSILLMLAGAVCVAFFSVFVFLVAAIGVYELEYPAIIAYYITALPALYYAAAILHFFLTGTRYEAAWLRWKSYAAHLLLPFTLIFCMTAIAVDDYQQQITVPASTMIELEDYLPFQPESKLARLDHTASLQLTGELPVIDGATALVPVYAAFAEAVYPHNGVYDFHTEPVLYSNTIGGYIRLAEGERDIMFGAYPSEDQIQYARECGREFIFTPIGQEGFVFFVNTANPIDNLTSEQVRGIYSGAITNWNQVGGSNRKIEAFQRNANSGSQSALIRFMGNTPLMTPPQDQIVDFMDGIIYRAADYQNHDNAIGFSFRYYAQDMIADKGIKLLSIDGIAPTVDNIRSGAYPLTSNFYAVTTQHSNANSQKLIDWILSPEGQQLIEQTGYAGINQEG